jgi:hypothetical protein
MTYGTYGILPFGEVRAPLEIVSQLGYGSCLAFVLPACCLEGNAKQADINAKICLKHITGGGNVIFFGMGYIVFGPVYIV